MTTIYDIAKVTGFSAPTVSKALNGSSEVSARTRERIVEAARQMGYTPNASAKTLTTKKSYLIGIVYHDLFMLRGMEHPLFAGIIDAFKNRMEEAGYEILFLSRSLGPRKLSYLEHVRARHVDAVYIVNAMPQDPNVLELVAGGVVCVSANDPFPGVPRVVSENYGSARTLAGLLAERGHRRIATLAGPQNDFSPAGIERLQGWRDELAARGLPHGEDLVVESEWWHAEGGYAAMKKLLARGVDASAVFVACDTLAYGAIAAAREAGLRLPQDLSIAGFDDYEVSAFIRPALTTIRQDRVRMGREAAELMLRMLAGEEVDPTRVPRVPTTLVERDSAIPYAPRA